MPFFLGIIWKALMGNLSGIVSSITDYLGKRSDNEVKNFETQVGANKEVAIAGMQAASNAYHDRVDLLKGMKATQWLIVAALAPPIIHQGMIYLDSSPFPTFFFENGWPVLQAHIVGSWHVPKVPSPYDDREWQMIGSLLGIQTGLVAVSGVLRWLHK